MRFLERVLFVEICLNKHLYWLRIYESHIFEHADKDANESDPRSNVQYLGSSKNKAEKNSGLYGI